MGGTNKNKAGAVALTCTTRLLVGAGFTRVLGPPAKKIAFSFVAPVCEAVSSNPTPLRLPKCQGRTGFESGSAALTFWRRET